MQTKVCTQCKTEKLLSEFIKDKTRSSGYRSNCKSCQSIFLKNNKERINKKRRDKLLEIKKDKNQYEKFLEKKRNVNNDLWARQQGYDNHKDLLLNKELKKAQSLFDKEFKKLSKNHTVKKGSLFYSEKYKQKREQNTQYKLTDNLRARIRKAMKCQWTGKKSSTAELLGMSGKEFYEYFLSLGYDKESDTIDHIIPISRFDLTKHEHQLIACHYLNLRPLPHFENFSKSDSLLSGWQEKLIQICETRNIDPCPVIKYIESGAGC